MGFDMDLDTMISTIDKILSDMIEEGYCVHQSSRYQQFKKDITKLKKIKGLSKLKASQLDLNQIIEGFRDFAELKRIYNSGVYKLCTNDEVKKLMCGARMDVHDSNNNSRTIQYQMLLAAIFKESGYNIEWEEPDFIINFDKKRIAVAVKRIYSKRKLLERIKEAEKQIEKVSEEGIIALSLDRLIDCYNPCIITDNPDMLAKESEKQLIKVIKEQFKENHFIRKPCIKAILTSVGLPGFLPKELSFGYGFALKMYPLSKPENYEFEYYKIIADSLRNNID